MDCPYQIAGNILSSPLPPDGNFRSVDLYGSVVQVDTENTVCSVFHLENESGTGDITVYPAFPGMELVYNDMHMAYCSENQVPLAGVMEINYCREGRCECTFSKQSYCYLSAGDLSICSLQKRSHISSFPTSHYHGITITIDVAGITEDMNVILKLLSIDVARIAASSGKKDFYMVRANDTIQHIFSELYTAQEHMKPSYIKVKLMELLLVLTEMNFDADKPDCMYYSQAQRDCMRQIHDFMIANIAEHHTIKELAKRFQISPTTMKSCFKGMYGVPIYTYIRTYRLQMAERLLREGNLSVSEIAAKIGYTNPNKFTSAFRSAYGVPPTVYKKSV